MYITNIVKISSMESIYICFVVGYYVIQWKQRKSSNLNIFIIGI